MDSRQRPPTPHRTLVAATLVLLLGFGGPSSPVPGAAQTPDEASEPIARPVEGLWRARTDCPWGAVDCSPCLQDAERSFAELAAEGTTHSFSLASASAPGPDSHWQGVQRLSGLDGRFLILTRDDLPCTLNPAGSEVQVRAASSGVPHGDGRCAGYVVVRLRSQEPGGAPWEPVPSASEEDRVLYEHALNDPRFDHAGGSQLQGRLLAVGLEKGRELSRVVIIDLGRPALPGILGDTPLRPGQGAGAVALARLDDDSLLLAVGGWDSDRVDFYRSPPYEHGSGSRLSFTFEARWDKSQLEEPSSALAYQNLNFVSQCDGQLFLAATGQRSEPGAPTIDRVDLYRLGGEGRPTLERRVERALRCSDEGQRSCSLRDAAGIYVDPEGRLVVYAAQARTQAFSSRSVRFVQFQSTYLPPTALDQALERLGGEAPVGPRPDSPPP